MRARQTRPAEPGRARSSLAQPACSAPHPCHGFVADAPVCAVWPLPHPKPKSGGIWIGETASVEEKGATRYSAGKIAHIVNTCPSLARSYQIDDFVETFVPPIIIVATSRTATTSDNKMAKRKRSRQQAPAGGANDDFDPSASKLRLDTYQDVADSEDEFHANRDKILVDGLPSAKRRRQAEAEDLELSDEEVLGFSESDDEADYSDEAAVNGAGPEDEGDVSSESGDASADDDESEGAGWGSKKADYYNADEIETEQDMRDEEAEARRIQQRQRKALSEADFGLDDISTWADADAEEADEGALQGSVVKEVLPQLQITDDMSEAERLKLLKSRYPEFEPLTKELIRLEPVYQALTLQSQKQAPAGPAEPVPLETIKYQALSGYMGALAMYFALLTSTAEPDASKSLPMPASELREHDVIASLEQYQKLWAHLESLELGEEGSDTDEVDQLLPDLVEDQASDVASDESDLEPVIGLELAAVPETPAKAASRIRRAARLQRTEEALAQLPSAAPKQAKKKDQALSASRAPGNDANSDLGDEQTLLPHELAAKTQKRKSLRFYTSQIAQKANKRANAGRAAGGDDDIPHRERLRDRQDRLNKEAHNRGRKHDLAGSEADFSADDGGDSGAMTNREREGGINPDEQALESKVLAKKQSKLQRDEAYKLAKEEGGRVVMRPQVGLGPDGRREVGYVIEKNKGLTPHRKKIVKNPRVKKRVKYEDKTKKLRSMKPTYRGGEAKGGYGGELTGIKKNLVRSTKF